MSVPDLLGDILRKGLCQLKLKFVVSGLHRTLRTGTELILLIKIRQCGARLFLSVIGKSCRGCRNVDRLDFDQKAPHRIGLNGRKHSSGACCGSIRGRACGDSRICRISKCRQGKLRCQKPCKRHRQYSAETVKTLLHTVTPPVQRTLPVLGTDRYDSQAASRPLYPSNGLYHGASGKSPKSENLKYISAES